jgi:hypothetical protein
MEWEIVSQKGTIADTLTLKRQENAWATAARMLLCAGWIDVRKPMKFLIHYALIFTISLLLLRSVVFPEFEQTGQFWSQIGTAVQNTGAK